MITVVETFLKNRYYTQINLHLLIKQNIIPSMKSLIFYYSTAFGNAGVLQAQVKAQLLCSREIKGSICISFFLLL